MAKADSVLFFVGFDWFTPLIFLILFSRPYSSRPSSVPLGEGSSAKSVFNRLGAPAGGAFARHSGLGGERRGESWYKITVSCKALGWWLS